MSEEPFTLTKGNIIRINPENGPVRVMRVTHVEHHIITLSDEEFGTEDDGVRLRRVHATLTEIDAEEGTQ